ncbi:hypothetical protein V9T40_001009 [Parthenolecanium corni]|uniref:Uncharacterized protein n=1 Tax=Parthenolecanium corni TaxID=536013 RepID=A0AAN9TAT9_9HEMI
MSGLSGSLSALTLSPRSETGFLDGSPRVSPNISPHFIRRKNLPAIQQHNIRNQLTVPLEDAPPIPFNDSNAFRITTHHDLKFPNEQVILDRHSSCPSVHSPFINSLSKAHTLPQLSPAPPPHATHDIIPPSYDQLRFTTDYENATIVPDCVETRVISAKRNPYISKPNLVKTSLQDAR